jgi:response regulator RpfG family c-di-GMP phosphodiesterase
MKKRILIVDDEQSVLNSLKRLFRNSAYDVRYALSGEEGLALLNEESVDLVISDMRMPGMGGAEFLFKAKEILPLTERIMITGYSDMASTIKTINDVGIFGYISKPWDSDALIALIESALGQTNKNRLRSSVLKRFKADNEALLETLKDSTEKSDAIQAHANDVTQKLADNYQVTEQVLLNLLDIRHKGEREFGLKLEHIAQQFSALVDLTESERDTLCLAARLHGVGKVGLRDSILDLRYQQLNEAQLAQYQEYPAHGACALMSYSGFQYVAQVIFEQKEYLDGSGYPNGLKAGEISRLGTILAIIIDYGELRFGKATGEEISHDAALQALQEFEQRYDTTLFPTLSSIPLILDTTKQQTVTMLPLFSLRTGMILDQDVYSGAGILLLPKSTMLTDSLIGHLCNIERNTSSPLHVCVRFESD